MSVLDASAAVELLLVGRGAELVRERLVGEQSFAAPEVLTVEVLVVLRRDLQRGLLSVRRAETAIDDLLALPVVLFSPRVLAQRAWAWRENMTIADALYVALAEAMQEPLLTADRRLANAAGAAGVDVAVVPV